MAKKCFLWVKHDFEFMPLGGAFRCTNCHRRWDFGGREMLPDDGSGSWALYESIKEKEHESGRWDMHSSSAMLRVDGRGNLLDEELAPALAECLIKKNGWKADKKEDRRNPSLAEYKKERREELMNFAMTNPMGFLKQVFGK